MQLYTRLLWYLLSLASFVPLSIQPAFAAAGDKLVRCGVVAALSGPLAPTGISIKNSILLASEQNSQSSHLQFLFEDDQYQPTKTVSAVHKFLEIDQVRCLIIFGSSPSLAVADIAERAHVPMISIAITPKVVENRPHVFRAYIPVEAQNAAIVSEIARRGYSRIAIVSSIQDATLALRELFVSSKTVEVVNDEQVNPEERDLQTIAAKIKRANPSAVFINLLPPQASIFSRQLRSSGYSGELFSGPPLGNLAEIAAAQGTLNDAWFVSLDDSNAQDYYSNYEKKFGEHPSVEGIYGYDAANLLITGALKGDLTRFLQSAESFKGLLGTYRITKNTLDMPAGLWHVIASGFEFCGRKC